MKVPGGGVADAEAAPASPVEADEEDDEPTEVPASIEGKGVDTEP